MKMLHVVIFKHAYITCFFNKLTNFTMLTKNGNVES